MKKALLIMAATVASFNASAELQFEDFNNTNDNLVVVDDSTQLRWLSLTLTADMSYAQVQSALSGVFDGYRMATSDEVKGMFVSLFDGVDEALANGTTSSWRSFSSGNTAVVDTFFYCFSKGTPMDQGVTTSAYATTAGYTAIERVDTDTGYQFGSYYSAMYNTSNGSSTFLYEQSSSYAPAGEDPRLRNIDSHSPGGGFFLVDDSMAFNEGELNDVPAPLSAAVAILFTIGLRSRRGK